MIELKEPVARSLAGFLPGLKPKPFRLQDGHRESWPSQSVSPTVCRVLFDTAGIDG